MTMTEEVFDASSPALVEAKIQYYTAHSALLEAQTRKETSIAQQHELAVKEGAKVYADSAATNINNRFYDFVGAVNGQSVEIAMQIMSRWKRQSEEPISVRISSPGGNVLEGLALYDFLLGLRKSGLEVRTVVLGMAASMAAVLLQAGSTRVIGPNARILIHEIAAEQQGHLKLSDMQDNANFFKEVNTNLYTILAERSTVGIETIRKNATRKDWFLSAKDIVGKGFADEIGFE